MTVNELVLHLQKIQKDGFGEFKVVRSDNAAYCMDGAEDIYQVTIAELYSDRSKDKVNVVIIGG